MIINLVAAALAGIFIPLALNRMKFDPAVSSTVFVTTVTDVVGFFSFPRTRSTVVEVGAVRRELVSASDENQRKTGSVG